MASRARRHQGLEHRLAVLPFSAAVDQLPPPASVTFFSPVLFRARAAPGAAGRSGSHDPLPGAPRHGRGGAGARSISNRVL